MKSIFQSWPLLAAVSVIFAISCARQGNPSGGPKDFLPPKLVQSEPANGATGFTGKTISITFDEFIVLDKIQEKFMISPPTVKKPQVVLKGKTVVVTIDEKLRDSTTYTLYFQDAIKDLNESNILDNFQFVFSTGSYIDSLSFSGAVYDAFTLEIPESMMVMMHSNLADSAPFTVVPDYISQVGRTGFFTFNNLRPGNYRLYALEDVNNNRKFEQGDESFAFLDTLITISTEKHFVPAKTVSEEPGPDTLEVNVHDSLEVHEQDSLGLRKDTVIIIPEQILFTSKSPTERYYLAGTARRQSGLLEFYFSMPLDTFKFEFSADGAGPGSYLTEVTRNRDTFRIWIKDSLIYSNPKIDAIISFPSTNKEGKTAYITDTVPMRFTEPTGRRAVPVRLPGLLANVSPTGIPPGRDIRITSSVPIAKVDLSRILIIETTDSLKKPLAFTPRFDSLDPRIIELTQALPEGKDYVLTLFPGLITTLFGTSNDSTTFRFKVRPVASYGTLVAKLTGYEGSVIVQILDGTEKLVMEQYAKSPGNANFRFIDNGTYRLKLIYDTDGNGVWTTGDYRQIRAPEAVSFFNEQVEIKSNWDMVIDWDISRKNQKDNKLRKQTAVRR